MSRPTTFTQVGVPSSSALIVTVYAGRCLPVAACSDRQDQFVEAEVGRLLGLGATRVEDWPYRPEATFVVLWDPSGNEFCVTEIVEL